MVRTTAGVLIAAFLALFAGCVEKEAPVMRIGAIVWPGYEGLYLAEHLGFYEGANIKMVQYPSSTDTLAGLGNGLIDAGALTADEALQLVDREVDFKIVLVMDYSNGADVLIGKKGMKTPRDIKGKRVGVEATALGAFMLSRVLDAAGLKLSDVTVVYRTINEHVHSFTEGEVDAVVTFEPVRSTLLKAGGELLFDSSKIPGEIIDILVVRGDFYRRHPEVVATLLEGYFKALARMKADPGPAMQFLAEREGVPLEQFVESFKGITVPGLEENRSILDRNGNKLRDRLQRIATVMKERGLLIKTPDFGDLVGAAPLGMVKK